MKNLLILWETEKKNRKIDNGVLLIDKEPIKIKNNVEYTSFSKLGDIPKAQKIGKKTCNATVTKIIWLHLSTSIPLSPLIAITYHLISNNSPFQYTRPHSSIIENWFSYITLLRNASARYLCHPTIFLFIRIWLFLI